jgi:hypothetical protein
MAKSTLNQKTILVVYTQTRLSQKEAACKKRYAFNTTSDINEGDIIESNEYDTPMQVVKVIDGPFKYYNRSTGELSNKFNSTEQWEIRNLVIREDEENTVYGKISKL